MTLALSLRLIERNMRLLLIGNFFPSSSGSWQYCKGLASRFEERGNQVLRVSRFRSRAFRLFDMAIAPWRMRAAYDVALVDVFSGPSFLWAEAATAALGAARKPVALTLHGGGLPAFAHRHPRRVRKLLCRAAEVTAPSSYLAEAMKPFRSDIKVIPNALELSRYPFRHRSGVKPNLIWLRAFHRIYAPEVAVQAMALLASAYPEAHLTMVGPNKDGTFQRCKEMVRKLSLGGRVALLSGVPKKQVPEVLSSGDIFLNTTRFESFGVSPMEAAACGLVLVTTSAGALGSMWRDGVDAMVIPVDDPAAMAAAVARLLRDPVLAARLSANARAKAAGFDWSNVLPQWEELLETLVACANRGGS